MIPIRRRVAAALTVLVLALASAACSDGGGGKSSASQNGRDEQRSIATSFGRVIDAQQIPVIDWSQERQTLIDTLMIRADGSHGTAEVTALDGSLLWWCPTAGAPIPSTYQLSNPEAFVDPPDRGGQTDVLIPQGEPTGVYPGSSEATYILCLDDAGKAFLRYDEANVRWTSGVVDGLDPALRAQVNEITFDFTVEGGG